MKDCLVVIPARHGSTRFPGKVLAQLDGRPIVEWCYRAAIAAEVGPVMVATENDLVRRVVAAFGGECVITSPDCASGTDRVFEAARRTRTPFVINLQGDQPLIRPETIRKVAGILRDIRKADIATAVIALNDPSRLANPNVVKAALAGDGRALYFSRAPIPFARNGGPIGRFEHLGIYGFRREALERFVSLPPSALEKAESLEQLRALEAGMAIYAALVEDEPVAIDTPEDLELARKILRNAAR